MKVYSGVVSSVGVAKELISLMIGARVSIVKLRTCNIPVFPIQSIILMTQLLYVHSLSDSNVMVFAHESVFVVVLVQPPSYKICNHDS